MWGSGVASSSSAFGEAADGNAGFSRQLRRPRDWMAEFDHAVAYGGRPSPEDLAVAFCCAKSRQVAPSCAKKAWPGGGSRKNPI